MTNQQHLITLPPELVQQWVNTYFGGIISHYKLGVPLDGIATVRIAY